MRDMICAVMLACLLIAAAHAEPLSFVTQEAPPFTYSRTGAESGIAIGPLTEIVEAACAALAKPCIETVLPWRRARSGAEAGEFFGLYCVLDTPDRRAAFFLMPPLVQSSYGFVVAEASTWIYRGPDSIGDRTISVYGPSSTSSVAGEIVTAGSAGALEIELSDSVMLRKVAAGRLGPDGVGFINLDIGRALIRKEGITGVKFAGLAREITYTIGLSRKRATAQDAAEFTQAIATLKASGRVREILARYDLTAAE